MTVLDTIDIGTNVVCMLEYMTLCADPTLFDRPTALQRSPAPSGIPMGILVMPDFVVDVAIDDIALASRGHQFPLEVGGRAGRLVRVLEAYGGARNAWYSVKYLAKAGDVGQVVLRRQFAGLPDAPSAPGVSLRYVLPAPKGVDWLHAYGGSGETVETSHEGLQLGITLADIEASPYLVTDPFQDARYIVIASKRTDSALQAISVLTEALGRLSTQLGNTLPWKIPIGLLVDFTALASQQAADQFVGAIAEVKRRAVAFEVETTALCSAEHAYPTSLIDHELIRGAHQLRIGDCRTDIVDLSGDPFLREAMTARYVLAAACSLGWKLLRQWYRYCPTMRPLSAEPHTSYPKEDPANQPTGVQAAPLPSLAVGAGEPIEAADRIAFAAQARSDTASSPVTYASLASTLKPHLGTPPLDVAITLADCRVPRFAEPTERGTSSLFLPASNVSTLAQLCFQKAQRLDRRQSPAPIRKVVMFDLDATLIDSAGMLKTCWFSGLRAFFAQLGIRASSGDVQTICEVYEVFVYKDYERFRNLLADHPDIPPEWQPCDFRQVWNHRYAWAALLWILEINRELGEEWSAEDWPETLATHRLQEQNHKGQESTRRCDCQVCQHTSWILDVRQQDGTQQPVAKRRELAMPLRRQLTRFKRAVQEGRKAFWDVDYPPYPQARSCVEMVRAMPDCEAYVVTEGHEETQLSKLRCAGLSDLFPTERVLSTGAASSAREARSDLVKLQASQIKAREVLTGLPWSDPHLQHLIEAQEKAIACTSFLLDALSALSSKANERFYCAVLDAILSQPDAPAPILQSLEKRPEGGHAGASAMRFFMVGDRYDNDCRPLLELDFGQGPRVGIGTCRLLSGKRAKALCPPRSNHPTMFVCDTLAQIGHLLRDESVWTEISELRLSATPPVLLEQTEGVIRYGPVRDGRTTTAGELKPPLALQFKHLALAAADEQLKNEPAVQDMVLKIESDLAKCSPQNLARLFAAVGNDVRGWCTEAKSRDGSSMNAAANLLRGGLDVLEAVNVLRLALDRRRIAPSVDPASTLEASLAAEILTASDLPPLVWFPRGGRALTLFASPKPALDGEGITELLLFAIPYSDDGIAIVERLCNHKHLRGLCIRWLDSARKMQSSLSPAEPVP